ncbi:uncharacterized protein CMU_032400 [Cryptosporidium muris RN66]|uniref:Uncharacterized protein n=1 Tax=Cryptosporidium muris (strain RN66) TaxID=441375 RepID=B6AIQ7_CRYMR|nr:uncharacterized protein CMU_032400 [Cryptosporidium muris RN66]EEA08098.1 hypothetical protein CMU_032400 [Cryptosporidium muris RN66]|eukprot:XP_002142447.1 hypothetical protein [Cryptosporidium muris RN66]
MPKGSLINTLKDILRWVERRSKESNTQDIYMNQYVEQGTQKYLNKCKYNGISVEVIGESIVSNDIGEISRSTPIKLDIDLINPKNILSTIQDKIITVEWNGFIEEENILVEKEDNNEIQEQELVYNEIEKKIVIELAKLDDSIYSTNLSKSNGEYINILNIKRKKDQRIYVDNNTNSMYELTEEQEIINENNPKKSKISNYKNKTTQSLYTDEWLFE